MKRLAKSRMWESCLSGSERGLRCNWETGSPLAYSTKKPKGRAPNLFRCAYLRNPSSTARPKIFLRRPLRGEFSFRRFLRTLRK